MYCFVTVHHCIGTVHTLKNIKNGSHDTIYTFKNYFATVFSVFSFNNNKFNPNGPIMWNLTWLVNQGTFVIFLQNQALEDLMLSMVC